MATDQIQAFMDAYRPLLGQVARLFNTIQRLEDAWTGGLEKQFSGMEQGEAMPVTSGLAGAAPLTPAEIIATMVDLSQALAAFNAPENRQAYIRAAGLANTI